VQNNIKIKSRPPALKGAQGRGGEATPTLTPEAESFVLGLNH